MNARTLRLGALASLLPLTACVNMSGLGGGSKYACAAPEGVACDSVSGTYANALHKNLPSQQPSRAKPGDPPAASSRGSVPTTAAPSRQPPSFPLDGISGSGGAPGLSLRSQARVLRLWTKAWEDADGDLWDQGFVYVQVDAGRWQIDHVRQRIRDQFAPLRPPPAAPSSGANSTSEPAISPSAIPEAVDGAMQRPASLNPFPLLSPPSSGLGSRPH
ncbi:MAG: TraV family lipoprotein [Acidovorax sp.]